MQSNDAQPADERLDEEIETVAAESETPDEDSEAMEYASAAVPKRDADDDDDSDDDDDFDDDDDDDSDDDDSDDDDGDDDDSDEDESDEDEEEADDEADEAVTAEAPPAKPARARKAAAASSDDESGEEEAGPALTDEEREAAFAAAIRMAEALLFAAAEPLDEATLRKRMPRGTRVPAVLAALEDQYRPRGVNLKKVAGRWAFMTAPDLQHMLEEHRQVQRKLSRAAIETLAIIAYHQPCTRAEIEDIRGVSLSRGTLDVLMEANWVKVRGRRRVPGRPVTYGITDEFLVHFGLESADALPGIEELRASGLLEALPASGGIPMPGEALDAAPEDPLDEDDDGREYLEPLVDEEADSKKAEAQARDQAGAKAEAEPSDGNA
ncbi:SMC-Scp complex subunit ScpB [Ferrovibrio sp.]|uniref:SMC-Scp complex subunit ScpB n=1 Tax=Ferrovibrio sp. TaxID=1917215 RepID=UPI00262869AE|nr:SMC-Scp complex subunit ScpB [Ferrovibrio sp.]